MPKVVKTSETPNPMAIKFHMDCKVITQGSLSFPNKASAQKDEVAKALFEIEGVESVFYINEVVTVNKAEFPSWDELIPPIADTLEAKLVSTLAGDNPVSDEKPTNTSASMENFLSLEKPEKIQMIDVILDETIRPGLAGDGGGVEITDLEEFNLSVHYEGACGSCPSASEGTLRFIEDTLRERVHPKMSVVAT